MVEKEFYLNRAIAESVIPPEPWGQHVPATLELYA